MKTLEAFYLRKPWYIILEDAKKSVNFRSQYHLAQEAIKSEKLNENELSKAELEFNRKNKVYFENEFFFVEGFMGKAAKALEIYWVEQIKERKKDTRLEDGTYLHGAFGKDENNHTNSKDSFNNYVNTPLRRYTKREEWEDIIKNKSAKQKQLEIKVNLGLAICEIATIILEDNLKSEIKKDRQKINQDLESVRKIRKIFENSLKLDINFDSVIEKQISFWKAKKNQIPDLFQDSHWIGYVRNDPESNYEPDSKNTEWSISKSYMNISKTSSEGYTQLIYKTPSGNNNYINLGIATYERHNKYIIGHFTRTFEKETSNSTPGFLIFPVINEDNQNLTIGMLTYFSMVHKKFITKRIIWQNTNLEHDPIEIQKDSDEFKNLDDSIKQFLYDRDRNQMLIPIHSISHLEENRGQLSLKFMMKRRTSILEGDDILKNFVGNYFVCYMNEQATITPGEDTAQFILANLQIDEVEIDFDKEKMEFTVEYHHPQNDGVLDYLGYMRRQHNTLQIFLIIQKEKEFDPMEIYPIKKPEERLALLNIFIPTFSENTPKLVLDSHTFFPGIISGLTKFHEPIAYRTAVINKNRCATKQDLLSIVSENRRENQLESILDYFRNQLLSSKVLIPKSFYDINDKYPNIKSFKRIGIVVRNIDDKTSLEILKLCNKDFTVLPGGEFFGSNDNDVCQQAEQWLSLNLKILVRIRKGCVCVFSFQ